MHVFKGGSAGNMQLKTGAGARRKKGKKKGRREKNGGETKPKGQNETSL